jgi:hypothetical protein
MSKTGVIEFRTADGAEDTFTLAPGVQLCVSPIHRDICAVRCVTDDQAQARTVAIHTATGERVATFNDEWHLTWFDSYVVSVAGVNRLWLSPARQLAYRAADGVVVAPARS